MAELSIKIKADIARALSNLDKLEKELKGVEKQTKKIPSNPAKPFVKAGKTIKANATPALQEFSRVIQDAPFGIQGVSNNIQQLTAQFGNLSRSAGGTGAALKAMVASLAGPGGVLLAVSAVTSALVSYGPEILDFLKNTSEAEKAQRAFNEAIRDGVSNARGEISTLNALLKVAQDTTRTTQERERAIAKINDEYEDYLPNLTTENINTEKVRKAVDKLSSSLIRQAKIRGAQNAITKVTNELLELQATNAFESADAIDVLIGAFKSFGSVSGAAGKIALEGLKTQTKEAGKLENKIKTLQGLLQGLISEDITEKGIFSSVSPGTTKFKNNFKNLDDIFGINQAAQSSLENLDGTFKAIEGRFDKFGNLIGTSLLKAGNKVQPGLARIEGLWRDFNASLQELTFEGLGTAISSLGRDIGVALANGGNILATIGGSIINSFGRFISAFGEQLIQYGVGALAFSAISKALTNPITAAPAAIAAIAIGTALSAAGSALSNISGQGLGYGSGGNVSGGSDFRGSNTATYGGGFSGSGGEVVFRIQGNALVGVLRNTLNSNSRLGGSLSIG